MSDTTLQVGAIAGAVCLMFMSYTLGSAVATEATIKEAQRAAVIAGAARWSANQETGKAQFDFIQCLNQEIK